MSLPTDDCHYNNPTQLIEKYKNRFPSNTHTAFFTDEYRLQLYMIISSLDVSTIPHDLLFLILNYYGFGRKWFDTGILINFNVPISDHCSLTYNPYTDEYCRKDWGSSNMFKYKLSGRDNTIVSETFKLCDDFSDGYLCCFDLNGDLYVGLMVNVRFEDLTYEYAKINIRENKLVWKTSFRFATDSNAITYDSSKNVLYTHHHRSSEILVLSPDSGELLYKLEIYDDTMTTALLKLYMFPVLFIPYNVNGRIKNVLMFNANHHNIRVCHIYTIHHKKRRIKYYDTIKHGLECDEIMYDTKRNRLLFPHLPVSAESVTWYERQFQY